MNFLRKDSDYDETFIFHEKQKCETPRQPRFAAVNNFEVGFKKVDHKLEREGFVEVGLSKKPFWNN